MVAAAVAVAAAHEADALSSRRRVQRIEQRIDKRRRRCIFRMENDQRLALDTRGPREVGLPRGKDNDAHRLVRRKVDREVERRHR